MSSPWKWCFQSLAVSLNVFILGSWPDSGRNPGWELGLIVGRTSFSAGLDKLLLVAFCRTQLTKKCLGWARVSVCFLQGSGWNWGLIGTSVGTRRCNRKKHLYPQFLVRWCATHVMGSGRPPRPTLLCKKTAPSHTLFVTQMVYVSWGVTLQGRFCQCPPPATLHCSFKLFYLSSPGKTARWPFNSRSTLRW
jgi:hypothetical protein